MKPSLAPLMKSEKQDWGTPVPVIVALEEMFGGFDLDVCATPENAKSQHFFTPEENGLEQDWVVDHVNMQTGETYLREFPKCWMNPPYQDSESACKKNCTKKRCPKRGYCVTEYQPGQYDWVKKAFEESQKGCTVVCLIPARTDTGLWHEFVMRAAEVLLVEGRIKFEGAKDAAPFPSAVVVFRPGENVPVFKSWSVPK